MAMKQTVGTKIGMGFAAALLILIGVSIIAYFSASRMVETANMVTHTHKVLEQLAGTLQAMVDAETGQRGYILTSDDAYQEIYKSGIDTVKNDIKKLRELTSDNPEQQRNLDKLEPIFKEREAALQQSIDTFKSKGLESARQAITAGKGKKAMDDVRDLIADMKQIENTLLTARIQESNDSIQATNLTILICTIAAVVALSLAGFLITRNIARPLQEITAVAERISAGELDTFVNVDMQRRDEVGVLGLAFDRMARSLRQMADAARKIANGDLQTQIKPQSDKDVLGTAFAMMIDNLRRLTSQITEGVGVLGSSANQISTSTTQLASSAAQTATAVSEATTTVEEVRQTAQLSSQKSKSVSDNAAKMSQISQSGTKSTEETVAGIHRVRQQMTAIADSMVRLSEQSQTIGQIVATVEDLAAQSDILAVNASIEAAKAGEHGKGFGVVAQEVRSLAEQSKQATNQVRNILQDIQKATSAAVMATEQGSKAVDAGVKQAGEAGQSIQTLTHSVAESAQAATQIAASSQQQLVGVDQVASAMESIKQASTQNVVSAKQLEASAHNLKELSGKLRQLVEHYKI
jgi:methyl-accepting chemotaxis protein